MKKTYLYGAMAMGLLFTGCSSDDLSTSEANQPLDRDQTLYVSMKITGDMPGTRAGIDDENFNGTLSEDDEDNFDAGVGVESNVGNVYFVFYDDNGNVVGDVVEVDIEDFEKDENTVGGAAVESSYSSVVALSVRKGEKKPSKVICYINPINSGTLNVSLNRIQTVTRPEFATGTGDAKLFAMSNSVYYPDGEAPGSLPQVAVEINPSTQLFETQGEAEEALKGNNVVKVYVERYATKLAFAAANPDEYETRTRVYNSTGSATSPVILTFVPQFWAVNAQAKENYVIKSFREESADGVLLGENYTYEALNNVINKSGDNVLNDENAWDWNNPDLNRSYWGMSPAYFTHRYPEVSHDVMPGGDAAEVNQKYISYNELVNGAGFDAANTTAQYFRETTVGSIALQSENPAAAVASVIYVGEYKIKVNGTELTAGTPFYTYLSGKVTDAIGDRPYVYFENVADGSSKVAGGESMLKRFCAQATSLFRRVVDANDQVSYERLSIYNPADWNKLVSAVKVDTISDEVKIAYDGDNNTKLKIQANSRTLQFKTVSNTSGVYILTGNGYKEVVADTQTPTNNQITMTQANLSLFRQVGISYYYNLGHAYFNIPVKHLGWYRKGNDQKNDTKIDWNKVRVGDFGMVRNHSYKVNVSEITGLASGISGDNVPIVPPATPTDYFMAYSVRILKWAVVPTQSVKL